MLQKIKQWIWRISLGPKKYLEINGSLSTKKLVYQFEYFKKREDFNGPLNELKDENQFSETKIMQELISETGENHTMVYCKSDKSLLADAFSKIEKDSIEVLGLDPL